uniref:Fructose-bisphosphate aldolase n=1 Tax=Macrostomum lignano TaxID=282301 RepID=A0A1I8F5Y3_9PLAT
MKALAPARKRFQRASTFENTEENRAPVPSAAVSPPIAEVSNYISGVILFHETFYQRPTVALRSAQVLQKARHHSGIKVDKGVVRWPARMTSAPPRPGRPVGALRPVQEGRRPVRQVALRAEDRAKHAVPTRPCWENANVLARYASICQQNGLVPIDGDHDLATAQKVTEQVLAFTYKALADHHVYLEGTLLKPNMVTCGQACPVRNTPQQVAEATVTALSRGVPPAVVGITFLSGGQSEEDATVHLDAINKFPGPQAVGPDLQLRPRLAGLCAGGLGRKKENVKAGQDELLKRARPTRWPLWASTRAAWAAPPARARCS